MKLLTPLLALTLLGAGIVQAAPAGPRSQANLSLRNEVETAINKGLVWLTAKQTADGTFIVPENAATAAEHPSLTALPALAMLRSGKPDHRATAGRALAWVRKQAKEDGGIYIKGLSNYNTAIVLQALLAANEKGDDAMINGARKFIVAQQATGMVKPELDGGIGYGPTGVSPKRQHPDLDNMLIGLEALHAFRQARPNVEVAASEDLNWKAAVDFISRTQNLKSHNPLPWASDDAANKGGFLYYPGFSNAGEMDLPDGGKALRSYGSMTYGGMLSFLYADLEKTDPRVQAALTWLNANYTLEENPGLGRQGLYYYYHLMAKGLATAGVEKLKTAEGKQVDWSRELALKLINLQAGDGSWVSDTARWMEKDPVLVTTYMVMALQYIHGQL